MAGLAPQRIEIAKREVDTLLIGGLILAAAVLLAGSVFGSIDLDLIRHVAWHYLGWTAPIFASGACFLLWTAAALVTEWLGIGPPRNWTAVASGCTYAVEIFPYLSLVATFVSIIRALQAYAVAGPTLAAQATMIEHVAIGLGTSAAGCAAAFLAYTLNWLIGRRGGEA